MPCRCDDIEFGLGFILKKDGKFYLKMHEMIEVIKDE